MRHGLRNAMIPVDHLDRHRLRHRRSAPPSSPRRCSPGRASARRSSTRSPSRDLPVLLGLTLVVVLVYGADQPARRPVATRGSTRAIRLSDVEVVTAAHVRGAAAHGDDRARTPLRWPAAWRAPVPTGSPTSPKPRRCAPDVVAPLPPQQAGRWSASSSSSSSCSPAVFAPLIAQYSYSELRHRGRPAAGRRAEHWFGTDTTRPRRVRPGRLRHPGLADDRHPGHRLITMVIGVARRRRRRLRRGRRRHVAHADHRHPPRHPLHRPGHRHRRDLRSQRGAIILVLGLTGWLAIARIVGSTFLQAQEARVRRGGPRRRASPVADHRCATSCPT